MVLLKAIPVQWWVPINGLEVTIYDVAEQTVNNAMVAKENF